jgi:hypothetical protein
MIKQIGEKWRGFWRMASNVALSMDADPLETGKVRNRHPYPSNVQESSSCRGGLDLDWNTREGEKSII